jgi:hypothetical protein
VRKAEQYRGQKSRAVQRSEEQSSTGFRREEQYRVRREEQYRVERAEQYRVQKRRAVQGQTRRAVQS